MVKYSIIIPTCNKNLTEKCLFYVSLINVPKKEYEVLVIHNVSKDDIKSVTAEYIDKIPNLKYIYEEMYGLMPSRHRGAYEAKGDILCYLDDDSFVDKDWLIAIEETFRDKDVVLAGGNNLPLFESPPPKWLNYFWIYNTYGRWLGQLSLIDFHKKKMKLPTGFAFGCNFIIKKDIFFKMGGTNPDTVPKDKQRFQGDGETALSLKLNQNGYFLHFNPRIEIKHFVPNERISMEYFKKRTFFQGVCNSFSQIRKENGFDYYSSSTFNNKEKRDYLFYVYRFLTKIKNRILRMIKNKIFAIYFEINNQCEKAYKEGYDFHQNVVKDDPDLLKWVLKENYLEL